MLDQGCIARSIAPAGPRHQPHADFHLRKLEIAEQNSNKIFARAARQPFHKHLVGLATKYLSFLGLL